MDISIRQWRLSDAKDLAAALSNQKVLNNLRDGLPYPYREQDAVRRSGSDICLCGLCG